MAAVAQNAPIPSVSNELPPPATTKKTTKTKKDKPSAEENAKLIQARLAQLEQEKAGEKTQQAEVDREVKKESKVVDEELNRITDPLERAEAIKKKYDALYADMRKLEREYTRSKKRADQLQKDKDKATSEFTKVNTQREKMEKLSRTFQQENKKLKDDNKRLEMDEKEARDSINSRLDSLLCDVEDVMNSKTSSHAEHLHMEIDEVIKTRCKVLFDQAELRELHFKSILRHKDAEIQHLQAKHEVERKRADAESTRCRTLTNQVSTFSHTEAELRSQLNIYVEKFKQVEDTLNNSNELFMTFRKEMEEMSKKTKILERENAKLTRKHDALKKNILDMAEERSEHLKELEKLRNTDAKMRNIIKGLQAQGRGGPVQEEMIDEEGTESEYGDEDYEDEDEEDEDYLEGEEEILHDPPPPIPALGPEPPPKIQHARQNGLPSPGVNGVMHQ